MTIEQRILDLQKDKGALIDKVRELKKDKGALIDKVRELEKENTELKTRWQCRNKYMGKNNGKVVPCYILYGCLNCSFKSGESERKNENIN